MHVFDVLYLYSRDEGETVLFLPRARFTQER